MIIHRTPPKYPRRGPSCLLVLFVIFGIFVGAFVIQNADEVRDVIIPTPTMEPTRSATEYALLASISQDRNEQDAAIGYYEEAIRLDATRPQFYIELINLLVDAGRAEEALTWAEDVTLLANDDPQVWTVYAAALLANGDRLINQGDATGANLQYAEAIQAANQALALDPQNATALAYVAGGLISQRDPNLYEEAQIAAIEATLLDPNSAVARAYLADVYESQALRDAAREQWQLGIQANPNDPDLHIGLAYNYFAVGNTPNAILSFNQALEVDPDNAAAYDGLAFMYLQLGQPVQAQENALLAIEKDANMARAYGRLGEAYYAQNNYENAIDALITATNLYGEATSLNARFFYYLGSSYLRLSGENCPQAVPYLQQVADVFGAFQQFALEDLVFCREQSLQNTP